MFRCFDLTAHPGATFASMICEDRSHHIFSRLGELSVMHPPKVNGDHAWLAISLPSAACAAASRAIGARNGEQDT